MFLYRICREKEVERYYLQQIASHERQLRDATKRYGIFTLGVVVTRVMLVGVASFASTRGRGHSGQERGTGK